MQMYANAENIEDEDDNSTLSQASQVSATLDYLPFVILP